MSPWVEGGREPLGGGSPWVEGGGSLWVEGGRERFTYSIINFNIVTKGE